MHKCACVCVCMRVQNTPHTPSGSRGARYNIQRPPLSYEMPEPDRTSRPSRSVRRTRRRRPVCADSTPSSTPPSLPSSPCYVPTTKRVRRPPQAPAPPTNQRPDAQHRTQERTEFGVNGAAQATKLCVCVRMFVRDSVSVGVLCDTVCSAVVYIHTHTHTRMHTQQARIPFYMHVAMPA